MAFKVNLISVLCVLLLPLAYAGNDQDTQEVRRVIESADNLANTVKTENPFICAELNNPIVENNTETFEQFKAKVVAGEFTKVAGIHEIYKYGTCTQRKYSVPFQFIHYQTSSCSKSFERTVIGASVTHELGRNRDEIKSALAAIITANSGDKSSYRKISATSYQFVSGEYIYTFNLAYPAEANPLSKAHITSTSGDNYALIEAISYSL
ncbi:MAG: hypothetical protein AABY86_00665 [Bdellovibrionota bacterium]